MIMIVAFIIYTDIGKVPSGVNYTSQESQKICSYHPLHHTVFRTTKCMSNQINPFYVQPSKTPRIPKKTYVISM